MQTWEQYERSMDPEGGAADFAVDLKWSLWSAREADWRECAADALAHLKVMLNNTLAISTAAASVKKSGQVTITGTAECEDAPGELEATGRFEQHWDDVEKLTLAYFDCTDAPDSPGYTEQLEKLIANLPYANEGTPGVFRTFHVKATSVAELLRLVDAEEEALIADSESAWERVKAGFDATPAAAAAAREPDVGPRA